MTEKVYRIGAPKSTNEAHGRSISCNQQIGAKRSATIDISQELIGNSPNTPENYKEVQVGLGVDCQYVIMRRFGVCVAMA